MPLSRREFVILAAAAAACRPAARPLRVGLPPWPPNDLYYLAGELGHYRGEAIHLVDHAAADQALQAFRNGVVDVCPCTLDEALALAVDLPDVRVVQALDSSDGADAILTQPELGALEDLRGRRIGYEATALGAYLLSRGLEVGGLGPINVTLVPLPVDEHARAFRERRVDAVVTYEPVRSQLLAEGANQVFDSRRIPGEIVDVVVARRRDVVDRAHLLATLARGWLLAARALEAHPKESAETLAPRMDLAPDAVLDAFSRIHLYGLTEGRALLAGDPPPLAQVGERLLTTLLAARLVDRAPDLTNLFDPAIVERITLPTE